MQILLIALAAAAAGVLLGWLIGSLLSKGELQRQKVMIESLQKREAEVKSDMEARLREAKEDAQKQLQAQKEDADRHYKQMLDEKDKVSKEAIASLQKNFDETVAKVSAQMKTATEDMLKERQREFSETSKTSIGQIVTPLQDTIDKMKKAMEENKSSQDRMSGEMRTNVENMLKCSEEVRKSSAEMTKAFRHESKVQGDWGEAVLNDLLQGQGLTPGIHYDVQQTMQDADGNTISTEAYHKLRPDIILHLDKKRDVIIDSKVSLEDFIKYVNAENDPDRKKFLKAHLDSLWRHVVELSKKDYSSYIAPPKERMTYVIMFVPHAGALLTALNADATLWRRAMEQNVLIVDELTLYAALKMVSLTWTQIKQAENHQEVFKLASEMLDRVGQFMKKFKAVGNSLDSAKSTYDDAYKKLLPGGQSILQTCAKLQNLGARQSRNNPIPQLSTAKDSDSSGEDASEPETRTLE